MELEVENRKVKGREEKRRGDVEAADETRGLFKRSRSAAAGFSRLKTVGW